MNRRDLLRHFIRRAKRNLNLERLLVQLQYGIFLCLALCTAILVVSRLFVFPYYREVTIYVGIGILIVVGIYIWWKRIRDKEALHRLDAFYPHNELVTALSFNDRKNLLVQSLIQKAENESPKAFDRFKKRQKVVWKPKVLIGIMLLVMGIGILSFFPSATQQEALEVEKEHKIINEIEKEVAKLEKKTTNAEAKKQLQELSSKLKDIESSEEALREVVKKQKELKLQEQKLKEKEALAKQENAENAGGLSAEEQKQLEELAALQKGLTDTAKSSQTALSKLGKPISFDLQNAIASELGSESAENEGEQGDSSEEQVDPNSDSQKEGQQGDSQDGNNSKEGQSSNGQNGQGQGQGQGQGNGSQGSGSGNGKGNGQGPSGGGSGAGLGQGSRDSLSIPNRIGGSNETSVDGGPLNEGKAVGEQKGQVPVTKGTIRPYEEVIGDYKDSYIESSERMQLPKDLQDIVQSYFSSIESE